MLAGTPWTPEHFGRLSEKHVASIYGWLLFRSDASTAADLAVETLAEAWQHRARFRGDDDSVGGWLMGIARNLLLRYYRSHRVENAARARIGMRLTTEAVDETDEVERRLLGEALRPQLEMAMKSLSANEREAVEEHIVAGRPYADLAPLLGCTEQAARLRVSRGLRRLRRELKGVKL
jgi:RNA polymerase sigma factor (sigma-70 family)